MVEKLESEIASKAQQRQELEESLRDLNGLTLPAVKQLERILRKEGRSSAIRDYALFAAGVVCSIIIAIILKAMGVG